MNEAFYEYAKKIIDNLTPEDIAKGLTEQGLVEGVDFFVRGKDYPVKNKPIKQEFPLFDPLRIDE